MDNNQATDNFITGGSDIAFSSYSSEYNFDKDFVDSPVVPLELAPLEKIECSEANRKLKFYSIAHNTLMIGGTLCVIGMGLVASSAKDNSKDHIFFILLIVGFAMIGLGLLAKYFGTFRFRGLAVTKALEANFDDVKYVNTKEYMKHGLFSSKEKMPSPDSDLLHNLSPQECVSLLKIGSNAWNRGIVKNELKASYHGMEFHYFDATMEYITDFKAKTAYPCFVGQIYIFKCRSENPLDYFFIPENEQVVSPKLSCYPEYFKPMCYEERKDPFVTRYDGIISSVKKAISGDEPKQPESLQEALGAKDSIQSPEFMECMIRLKSILEKKKWGVRVKNGFIILYIESRKNMFEYSFGKTDKAMKKLCDEVNEMRSIVDCFAEYSLAKP